MTWHGYVGHDTDFHEQWNDKGFFVCLFAGRSLHQWVMRQVSPSGYRVRTSYWELQSSSLARRSENRDLRSFGIKTFLCNSCYDKTSAHIVAVVYDLIRLLTVEHMGQITNSELIQLLIQTCHLRCEGWRMDFHWSCEIKLLLKVRTTHSVWSSVKHRFSMQAFTSALSVTALARQPALLHLSYKVVTSNLILNFVFVSYWIQAHCKPKLMNGHIYVVRSADFDTFCALFKFYLERDKHAACFICLLWWNSNENSFAKWLCLAAKIEEDEEVVRKKKEKVPVIINTAPTMPLEKPLVTDIDYFNIELSWPSATLPANAKPTSFTWVDSLTAFM